MADIITWDKATFTWDNSIHRWDLLIQEITSASGDIDPVKLQKLDKKKKKKLVRLIMHKNGIKVYDEKKEIKTLHHKIKDIELIAEEIKRNVQIIH